MIDLLASDVDLNGGQGEPAHRGEGLHGAQKSAMSPVDPALSVLGLGERHAVFRFHTRRILRFMQPEGEPTGRRGLGEHRLNRPRARSGQLAGDVTKLFRSAAFVCLLPSFAPAQSISRSTAQLSITRSAAFQFAMSSGTLFSPVAPFVLMIPRRVQRVSSEVSRSLGQLGKGSLQVVGLLPLAQCLHPVEPLPIAIVGLHGVN